MEKNSKFTRSFSWGCFKRHTLRWFHWYCFWSPYFFNHPFCGIPRCTTRIIWISFWSRDLPASTVRNSMLSPPLHPPLVPGNSLPNSCVTDGCWFSSISPFAMFTKSMNLIWVILNIYHSFKSNALAAGCLYCHDELTAWQVSIALVSKPNREKYFSSLLKGFYWSK